VFLHSFPLSLQVTAKVIPQDSQWQIRTTFYPVRYALIILPFIAIQSEKLAESFEI
jgi:hypothetical protein